VEFVGTGDTEAIRMVNFKIIKVEKDNATVADLEEAYHRAMKERADWIKIAGVTIARVVAFYYLRYFKMRGIPKDTRLYEVISITDVEVCENE